MEPNCKTKFNLDHIYCHPNDSNYIRANTGNTSADVLSLLKENKHLKAMLLLHLDLIQEQSDQLMAKDKLITTLREENDTMKLRLERMERKSQLRSSSSSSISIHNNNSHKTIELLPRLLPITTPSPPTTVASVPISAAVVGSSGSGGGGSATAAITSSVKSSAEDFIEDKKENIPEIPLILDPLISNAIPIVQMQQISLPSPPSVTTTVPIAQQLQLQHQQKQQQNNKYKICDEIFSKNDSSIIGESNGKLISKIVLQRVQIPGHHNLISKRIESPINKQQQQHQQQHQQQLKRHQIIKDYDNHDDSDVLDAGVGNILDLNSIKNLTTKQFQNILAGVASAIKTEPEFHHNDTDTILDEDILHLHHHHSLSFENIENESLSNDQHQQQHTLVGANDDLFLNLQQHENHQLQHLQQQQQRKRKRLGFMTTKRSYRTREWENCDEQINTDEVINKEEVEALKAEEPNLEIPKWTIKEFTGLYSIEGTEDLSDDVFLKRHAKLEYDEKRRKKWDVQRIREQRTIERLRRRHYKDEIQLQTELNENQEITTFYPTSDQIKFIQLTEDLPVQAFGDCIPRLMPSEFCLPWRDPSSSLSQSILMSPSTSSSTTTTPASTSSHCMDSSIIDSPNTTSFVFLKKKRRLQSQGTPAAGGGSVKRGKKVAASK